MTSDAPSTRRVLLLASCFADAAPSIRLAVAVASRMQASLEGVLAVDARAEGAAALLAFRHRSGAVLALDRERLSQSYAADARAFRRRLDAAAAGASLRWSFRTDSGVLPELGLGMCGAGDAVIFGQRRFLAFGGAVIALDDSETGSAAALATELARVLRLHLRVLPTDTPPSELDLLAPGVLVLPHVFQADPARLDALIGAARCPVLLGPAE